MIPRGYDGIEVPTQWGMADKDAELTASSTAFLEMQKKDVSYHTKVCSAIKFLRDFRKTTAPMQGVITAIPFTKIVVDRFFDEVCKASGLNSIVLWKTLKKEVV